MALVLLLKQRGFTLVELILVIILSAIVFAGSSSLVLQGFSTYRTTQYLTEANYIAKLAFARMQRDIENIASRNAITTASTTALTFKSTLFTSNTLVTPITITYGLTASGGKNNLTMTHSVNGAFVLAYNVTDLTFTYYDTSGNLVTSPLTAISYIGISLTLNFNNIIYTSSTIVSLRNVV
jgi:prepilin-type N-terminal cleavage/methylation domain-containing protein